MILLSQTDIVRGGPVLFMTVNLKCHAAAFPTYRFLANACIITKLRSLHFHKRQSLMGRQRCSAIVHLPVSPSAAAAAPDLQALLIYLFRRGKASASASISGSAHIKHQIQKTTRSGTGQTDIRICFLTDPASRYLFTKRAFCPGRRKFQRNTADKFRIRSGRIKRQKILARPVRSLRRCEKRRTAGLGMSLQHSWYTMCRCTASKQSCQLQICLLPLKHRLQPWIFVPYGSRMDQQFQIRFRHKAGDGRDTPGRRPGIDILNNSIDLRHIAEAGLQSQHSPEDQCCFLPAERL